jgi:hypothetical protein
MGGSGWERDGWDRPGAYSDPVYGAGRPRPQPGGQPYGAAGYGARRSAVAALVLGILGLAFCGLLAPVAWIYGSGAIEDNVGTSDEGMARAGQILGIIGTAVLVLGTIFMLLLALATPDLN